MDEVFIRLLNYSDKLPSSLVSENGKIEGNAALLVWQFLRFNKKYQKDYDIISKPNEDEDILNFFEDKLEGFKNRWCLEFPIDYNVSLPEKIIFTHPVAVKEIKPALAKFEKYLVKTLSHEINRADGTKAAVPPLKLLIDPLGDSVLTVKKITEILNREKQKYDTEINKVMIKGSSKPHLLLKIFFYYCYKIEGIKPKKLIEKYNALSPHNKIGSFQNHQIKRLIDSFITISNNSPWCFFYTFKK